MADNKTSYCAGADMLLLIGGKAVGHCTTHTATISSETKDRAVKPASNVGISDGLWKEKGVTGLSVSISAEGLVFYQETEYGYKSALAAVGAGKSVEVKCVERAADTTPYLSGKFVITSLEMTAAMGEDVTYSISLENDGKVTLDPAKLTGETVTAPTQPA